MKRILFFAALSIFAFVSCNHKEDNVEDSTPIKVSLSATFENAVDSKATLSSRDVIWLEGDQIGLRLYKGEGVVSEVDSYGAWDKTLTLSDGEGTANGVFDLSEGDADVHWGYAAFYPRFEGDNYVDGSANVSFLYQTSYTGYVSGTFLAPMVANMNTEGLKARPKTIAFKHVGGVIKVTLNGVPAGANKVSLAVAGTAITGRGTINPANAGTDAISALDGVAGAPVSLSFATAANDRNMVFYFPVPTLTAPVITVKLYQDNTEVWTKTTTKAQPNVGRGDVLSLSALTVEPYYAYVLDDSGSRWPGSEKAVCVSGIDSWPGRKTYHSETISGNTYKRFLLPIAAVGGTRTLYFNNNYSENASEVVLPSVTISAGTHSYYFRTDGLYVASVADASSPAALSVTNYRIWALMVNSFNKAYVWQSSNTSNNNEWPGEAMTQAASSAKLNGKNWYYYDPSIPNVDRVIFNDKEGASGSQTTDLTIESFPVYFETDGDSVAW